MLPAEAGTGRRRAVLRLNRNADMDAPIKPLQIDAPALALLAASGLPTDDLGNDASVLLFGTPEGDEPAGV
ncbi:hypothetical protein MRO49_25620, partial [Escherichia coli]|nr:hypothetical protein [Escherichia coli]